MMADKREAALNAKIAAIRAANEALERRHAEVEADKKLAEKKKSAVDTRTTPEGTPHAKSVERDLPPTSSTIGGMKVGPNLRRNVDKNVRASAQDRIRRDDQTTFHVKSRLGDADGPPPDPGYNFLADRDRDRDEENDSIETGKRSLERRGGNSSRKSTPNPSGRQIPRSKLEDRWRGGGSAETTDGNSQPKLRPPFPFGTSNGAAHSERSGSMPRDSKCSTPGFASQQDSDISKAFSAKPKCISPPPIWRCPDPGCQHTNSSCATSCQKCGIQWEKAQAFILNKDLGLHRKVKEEDKGLKIVVQFDKMKKGGGESSDEEPKQESAPPTDQPTFNVPAERGQTALPCPPPLQMSAENVSQWQPLAIDQWAATEPFTPSRPPHWSHQQQQQPLVDPFVMGNWTQVPEPQQQWTPEPMQNWTNDPSITWVQHPAYTSIPSASMVTTHLNQPPPPSPFIQIPFGDPHSIMVQGSDLMSQHPHIAQHTIPIMPNQPYLPPRQQTTYYNNSGSNTRPYRYSGPNSRDNSMRKPNSGSSSSMSWRDTRDREITKIPPRFQKQRVPIRPQQPRRTAQNSQLPRAEGQTAPSTAKRISIFGNSNIINNLSEADLSKDLGIPVRLIPAANCSNFRDKIGMIDPALGRFVLVHGLCNDAKTIAIHSTKTDVEKGADSDQMAYDFSDIIADLLERIPYLTVFISTLLPRFDLEEQFALSCPNNVRKVMNVEISSRLGDNDKVIFINNDTVLEWWKDEVKKHRLFNSDGHQLTAYGFSVMLDHWMISLKREISNADLEEVESPIQTLAVEPPTPQMASVFLTESVKENPTTVHPEHTLSDQPELSAITNAESETINAVGLKIKSSIDDPAEAVTTNQSHFVMTNSADAQIEVSKVTQSSVEVVGIREPEPLKPEDIPLGSSDEEDEFHEAKHDQLLEQPQSETSSEKDEFREKNNDELMEKEIHKDEIIGQTS